ncbi:hypothetical protein GGD65_005198, partial [Bradyrhizobium sp. CIR18]|nr:hypothetical protein [Bradyrhizobium sp. CIR18]
MAEGGQEECVVPASALDFTPEGSAIRVGSQNIEGEPAQNGEILGGVVTARAVAILSEMDVENPMELI